MAERKIKVCDFCNDDDEDIRKAVNTCELCKKDFCVDCGGIGKGLKLGLTREDDVEYDFYPLDDNMEMAICNECREMYENLFENKQFKKKIKDIIELEVKKHLITKNLGK